MAVLHMDWAEQHKISEVKEVQSAFFVGKTTYEIHTGYQYTKTDSHGFASLSIPMITKLRQLQQP